MNKPQKETIKVHGLTFKHYFTGAAGQKAYKITRKINGKFYRMELVLYKDGVWSWHIQQEEYRGINNVKPSNVYCSIELNKYYAKPYLALMDMAQAAGIEKYI